MNIAIHGELLISLKSPLLIAGRGSPGSVLDAATALAPNGEVMIPASVIKGALREACRRLASAKNLQPCPPAMPCAAGKNPPCVLCQLFGTPGPDRPGLILPEEVRLESDVGREGGLHFTDAVSPGAAQLSTRPSVAIDRFTGAAADRLLSMVQVADPQTEPLCASVHGVVSDDAWKLLNEALLLVDGIGHSRTRGLGQVEVEFKSTSPTTQPSITIAKDVEEVALLRVTLKQPLVLGRRSASNITQSEHLILGSTLRGAIATAVLRGGVKPEDELFQQLFVDPQTCLHFSDALPTNRPDELPLPLPLTTLCCKRHPHTEGEKPTYQDVLLLHWLQERVLEQGGAPIPPRCPNPACEEGLKHPGGTYPAATWSRRIVTRLGRDVDTGAGMPSLLFSVEQILPGSVSFVGTVSRLNPEARRLLAQAGPIYLGRGRSLAQGRVSIELVRSVSLGRASLKRRWENFATAAAPLLEIARAAGAQGLPADAKDLIAVVARTDLQQGELENALFPGKQPKLLWSQHKTRRRGGWDQGYRPGKLAESPKPGPRPLQQVLQAGAVWLFDSTGQRPTVEELSTLEQQGLQGPADKESRHLGMGQVTFFPEVLLKGL